jgi:hypothetical protein
VNEYTAELNTMIWSFSRCHSFENCKYEWYLNYLLKDKDGHAIYKNEQNFYAAFGKYCHTILEKLFKNELSINTIKYYYENNFDEEVDIYDVPYCTRDKYFYLGYNYFNNLDITWLKQYAILGIEKECKFNIGNRSFIGYIDLLLKDRSTGNIIVIDHKSSEYPIGKKGYVLKKKRLDYNSYKRQLYMYSLSVFNEYGKYPNEIWWNYFKEQKWLKLPFIKEEYVNAIEWADNLIKEIYNEKSFIPKIDYFYCKNLCGFRNSCDYKIMGGE